MRSFLRAAALAAVTVGSTGCLGIAVPTVGGEQRVIPPGGALYTSQKAPLTIDFDDNPVGAATLKSSHSETNWFFDILLTGGRYAFDDVAIAEIAKNGGINEVSYADYEVLNVLGLYQRMRINVYGN